MIESVFQKFVTELSLANTRFSKFSYPYVRNATSIEEILLADSVFLVTPGRSGTKSLLNFCSQYTDMLCVHAPAPSLASVGYMHHQGKLENQTARYSFYTSRESYLLRAYQQNRVFVDGDCKNLPLVNEIAELLPNSKFIHIVRNPESFIKSGIRRGYYRNLPPELWGHLQSSHHIGMPGQDSHSDELQIKKIAYFWNEANEIAENLKSRIASNRTAMIVAENMFQDPMVIIDALTKLGLGKHIKKRKHYKIRRLNKQKKGASVPANVTSLIREVIDNDCPTKMLYYSGAVK